MFCGESQLGKVALRQTFIGVMITMRLKVGNLLDVAPASGDKIDFSEWKLS